MNQRLLVDHLADMAREHQAELLKLAREARLNETPRASLGRWRVGLALLVALALPAAFLLVRAW